VTCCRVWDLETGRLKKTLKGHTNLVTSVAISPDGGTLVSGCEDGSVRWVCVRV
jgi:WD40 repeat protein